MKPKTYTQKTLWDAIYTIIPSFKTVHDNNVYLNLPSSLNSAIIELADIEYRARLDNDSVDDDKYFEYQEAGEILHAAYRDLQDHSQFVFEKD